MKHRRRALWRAPFYLCVSLLMAPNAWSSSTSAAAAAAGAGEEDTSAAAAAAAGSVSVFHRVMPETAPNSLSGETPIIRTLQEGAADPLAAMKTLASAYGPYTNAGNLFYEAFMSQYRSDTALESPVLPREFVLLGNVFNVADDRETIHVLTEATREEVLSFILPKSFDGDQRVASAPYYQALRLAMLFGSHDAIMLHARLYMLAHHTERKDVMPYFSRMALSVQGTPVDDFVMWADIVQAVIVGTYNSADDGSVERRNTHISGLLDFCDLLLTREGWGNQLYEHFHGPEEALGFKDASRVFGAATTLMTSVNGFVGRLMEQHDNTHIGYWIGEDTADRRTHARHALPKAAGMMVSLHNSVERFLKSAGLVGEAENEMSLAGVEKGSSQEHALFQLRHEFFKAVAEDYLMANPYVDSLHGNPGATKAYDVFMYNLFFNIQDAAIAFVAHPLSRTSPDSFDAERYERKMPFLAELVFYLVYGRNWAEERAIYHRDIAQRSQEDEAFYGAAEKSLEAQLAELQAPAAAHEKAAEEEAVALRVFQEETRGPSAKALERLRGMRDLAQKAVKAAFAGPEEQTAVELATSLLSHFHEGGAGEEQLAYAQQFLDAAKVTDAPNAQEFTRAFRAQQLALIKEAMVADAFHIGPNAQLMSRGYVTNQQAKGSAAALKDVMSHSENTRQEKKATADRIETHTAKAAELDKQALFFEERRKAMQAALDRVKGEYARLTGSDSSASAAAAAAGGDES